MAKTVQQMRKKMANKAQKLVTKLGSEKDQEKVDKIRNGSTPTTEKEESEQ